MKIAAGMLAMALAAPAAGAEPQVPQLELRPKSAVALAHDAAPFVVHPSSEPTIQLLPREAAISAQPSVACGNVTSFCYDPASGHIEVNARDYMPNIRGLRRETINVRRDSITFKYSF